MRVGRRLPKQGTRDQGAPKDGAAAYYLPFFFGFLP